MCSVIPLRAVFEEMAAEAEAQPAPEETPDPTREIVQTILEEMRF